MQTPTGNNNNKPPVFTISGDNFEAEVERYFNIPKYKRNCESKKGTVLLVKITKGEIKPNDTITLNIGDKVLTDIAGRIEVRKESVSHAVQDEKVGICLMILGPKDFRV